MEYITQLGLLYAEVNLLAFPRNTTVPISPNLLFLLKLRHYFLPEMTVIQVLKDGAQTALFKDPVRTAQ